MNKDKYICGIDFGTEESNVTLAVLKSGRVVFYTNKMWRARLYVWWKSLWSEVVIYKEGK